MEPTTSRSILADLLSGTSPTKNHDHTSAETPFRNPEQPSKNEDSNATILRDSKVRMETSVQIERVPEKYLLAAGKLKLEPKNNVEIQSEDSQDMPLSRLKNSSSPGDESDKEVTSLNDMKKSEGENLEAIKKFIEAQEKQIQELEAEVKSTPKVQANVEPPAINIEAGDFLVDGNVKTIASADSLRKIEEAASLDHEDNVAVAASVINIILSESEAKLMAKRTVNKSGKTSTSPIKKGKLYILFATEVVCKT